MTIIALRVRVLKRNIWKAVCSYYSTNNDHFKYSNRQTINSYNSNNHYKYLGISAGLATMIFYTYHEMHKERILLEEASKYGNQESIKETVGIYRSDLPTFTLDDVSKHSGIDTGVWVTYKQGVYDITEFIAQHPGGRQIMMAAGSSLEPFWLLYGIHKTAQVYKMLEEMRIGNVPEEASKIALESMEDPYSNDPIRHKVLKVHSEKPFNAEPPPSLLIEKFHTPNELFYVRNHLPVPEVDPETYELEIEIEGTDARKVLSLGDIMKLPKHSITATVMCAGNRRSEMHQVREVKGLNWGVSTLGNAQWSGARLVDVLKLMEIDDNTKDYRHIHFEGLDADSANNPYTTSIPIRKALDARGDVLLAYEMNGKPISRDHGFPIRVIVPGTVGARNVKWLGRIFISKEECDSHWQQKDYKLLSANADPSKVDLSKLPSIQELPVTSAICKPASGETVEVKDGYITVSGYAWSGGGRKIIWVGVTVNGGEEWHVADVNHQDDAEPPRHWSWTLWTAKIPVKKGEKHVEIWAKATDSSHNTQPDSIENIWNHRGFLNNAYHRIKVNLKE